MGQVCAQVCGSGVWVRYRYWDSGFRFFSACSMQGIRNVQSVRNVQGMRNVQGLRNVYSIPALSAHKVPSVSFRGRRRVLGGNLEGSPYVGSQLDGLMA